MKKRIALFPGSFDPFTNGHFDLVKRGLDLFDEIIIGIGNNSEKKRYFELELIEKHLKTIYKNEKRVKVIIFSGLTAECARKHKATFLLRGLRNATDFEYEKGIAQANEFLNNELETLFLVTTPSLSGISSSIVREIHKNGGKIDKFLPYKIK